MLDTFYIFKKEREKKIANCLCICIELSQIYDF